MNYSKTPLLTRQLRFLPPTAWDSKRIHMIGCGGLGSTAAIILAKMGAPEIHLYDMDVVDEVNLANQFFGPSNLGQNKVDAIKENIKVMSGYDCGITHHGDIKETMNVNKDLIHDDIIILALDSNDVRRWFYKKIIDEFPNKTSLLNIFDVRMGGLTFDVFFSTNAMVKQALRDTPEDKNVPDDVCTAKAIAFNVFACSSFLSAMIRKHLTKERGLNKRQHIQVCMENNIIANLI